MASAIWRYPRRSALWLVSRAEVLFICVMVKHLAFWIGFFASALLIIPVAIGIWGAADEFARNVAVFLFGAISILVIILVLALFCRDWLLRKVLGTAETTLNDVVESLVKGVSAAANGDRETAEKEAQAFATSATGWYVWSGFYRWVIASALGLLLAFGAFTGTVLLFEQNRKLSEQTLLMGEQGRLMQAQTDRMAEQTTQVEMQNEIMTISLVSELREQLGSTVERTTLGELFAREGISVSDSAVAFSSPDGTCGLEFVPEAQLSIPPSPAIVAAIVDLGSSRQISEQIIAALQFLVEDNDSAIAFGALLALAPYLPDEPVSPDPTAPILGYTYEFEGLFVDGVTLDSSHPVSFSESIVTDFNCDGCEIFIHDSFATLTVNESITRSYSVGWPKQFGEEYSPNIQLYGGETLPSDPSVEIGLGAVLADGGLEGAALTQTESTDVCSTFLAFAEGNRIFRYFGRAEP